MAFLDETGLAELWSLVKAEDAKLGNCKIETGSYTGTGNYGHQNPNSLTFSFKPKIVFISHGGDYYTSFSVFPCLTLPTDYYGPDYLVAQGGGANLQLDGSTYAKLNGNTMMWYYSGSAARQLNESGLTYNFIAIG